jgi:hypothetical protein
METQEERDPDQTGARPPTPGPTRQASPRRCQRHRRHRSIDTTTTSYPKVRSIEPPLDDSIRLSIGVLLQSSLWIIRHEFLIGEQGRGTGTKSRGPVNYLSDLSHCR